MRDIVDKFGIISFEFWDTLFVRPGMKDDDYFEIMQKRHPEISRLAFMRREAGKKAKEDSVREHKALVLDDIYEKMAQLFNLSKKVCNAIKKTEKAVVINYALPRKSIIQILNNAVQLGRFVCIVADGEFDSSVISEILKKNGIGQYSKVLLSAEGSLNRELIFSEICMARSNTRMVYIGCNRGIYDNYFRDNGFEHRSVERTSDILRAHRKLGQLFNNVDAIFDNRFLTGYSAYCMFEDVEKNYEDDTYFNGVESNLTSFLFGPFFLSYTVWMLKHCKENKVDCLCYVYRDGYLFESIHNILKPYMDFELSTKRIYLTRALCNVMYAGTQNGLYNSVMHMLTTPQMKVCDFIRNRLAVDDEKEYNEILKIFLENGYTDENDQLKEREKYIRFIKQLAPYFDKNVGKMKPDVEAYCKGILENAGKVALFDVGYRGSACKFVKDYIGMDTIGYHLFAKEEMELRNAEGLELYSPIKYGLCTERETFLMNVLTEDLLNAQEPTVIGVKRHKGVVVTVQDESWEKCDKIAELQDFVLQYVEGFAEVFKEDIWSLRLDILNYFEFFKRFLKSASEGDAKIFKNVEFVDSKFMNANAKNTYLEWYNKRAGIKSVSRPVAVNKAVEVIESTSSVGFKTKVYNYLNKKGLLPCVKKACYWAEKEKNYISKGKVAFRHNAFSKKILDEMEHSIAEIKADMKYRIRPTVIFCGHMAAFDKGSCNFMNKLAMEFDGIDSLFVSEVPYIKMQDVKRKVTIDTKIMHKTPMGRGYDSGVDMPMSYEVNNLIQSKKYLQKAVKGMRKRFPDMGIYYAEYMAWYLYRYYNTLIDSYQSAKSPICFVVWNQFTTMHMILENICKERTVPIFYMEFGTVPGTINVEKVGQMGESLPAIEAEKFESMEVSKSEKSDAAKLIEYLKTSRMSRNVQPINDKLVEVKSRLKPDRPTVIYFGQNDFESGMYPYDDRTKKYHSPIYKTSDEAALAIEKIAIKNNYNYIYKPHPTIYGMYGNQTKFAASTIVVSDVDLNDLIDIADVCMTILSQAAYVSLIRNKATIMLGYNQLRGKGCVYEVPNKGVLERVMSTAIAEGYTEEQRQAFIKHVAQSNKYYLYDDLSVKGGTWGKSLKACAEAIGQEFAEYHVEIDKQKAMKVAVLSQMPKGRYSGGRSHAWNIAEALANTGNTVYFVANNEPVFKDAMEGMKGHDNIRFVCTNDYLESSVPEKELDYVVLIPHRDVNDVFYRKVRNFAIQKNAKLVLLNYESGNWVNKYLNNELNMAFWNPWIDSCMDGCLVLSSDEESMKYAKEFYLANPKYTRFDYWYPPINSIAADKVEIGKGPKENRIIAMIRLNDKYKGSYDILDIIDESMRGYTFVFIYGSGIEDENYKQYIARLEQLKTLYGINYEMKVQLSDYEKFVEISKAKVLLFPSYFEGYGTPPLEALYCQTACIAYDLPVLRESCGDNIIYAEYGNKEDLRNKLCMYLAGYKDGVERREKIYDIANFTLAAEKLDKLFRNYLDTDWRDPSAKTYR